MLPAYRPATLSVHYTTSCNTQFSAPKDGRDHRPKHVELIGIINKPLLLHLVGVYIIYSILFTSNLNCVLTCYEKGYHNSKYQESYYLLSTRLHDVTFRSIMCLTVPP